MTEAVRSSSTPIFSIRGLTKRFGGSVTAVDAVDLDIHEGEFFALLGPSGCGKTTLLRMLAGFETPTSGKVMLGGEDVSGVPPNQRPVNMVFQSYAVFPHMSVWENVAYGLKVEGLGRAAIAPRVKESLALVKLDGYGNRKPDQLSGGQRQRVALARALIKRPKVLLLDEPLSALDAKLREAMQVELVGLQQSVGITFVIVTHDQDEALSMADRIAVMGAGVVKQVASPRELYERPRSRFVADFIGNMNLFEGRVVASQGGWLKVACPGLGIVRLPGEAPVDSRRGVAVRPEKIRIGCTPADDDSIAIEATVERVTYHGSESRVYFRAREGCNCVVSHPNRSRTDVGLASGDVRYLCWNPRDTLLLAD